MPEDNGTVYFLGAGATRQDFLGAPLGDDLLDAIFSDEALSGSLTPHLKLLFDAGALQKGTTKDLRPRIDDVFTVLDTGIAGRAPLPRGLTIDDATRIRRLLIAAIAQVLEARLGGSRGPTAVRFAQLLRDRPATVISTNYDIAMDNALYECESVNYGVAVRSAVGLIGGVPDGRQDEMRHYKFAGYFDSRIRRGNVPLLKLHGSLNWLYCPRCDELDITILDKGAAQILASPDLGRCSEGGCTGRYQALLVGPSLEQRYENRILRESWFKAEGTLDNASNLVIIGYSLPKADYLIRAMFARRFATRSNQVEVVTVHSATEPEEDVRLERRYRQLLPACSFFWEGFNEYTLRLLGSRKVVEDTARQGS